MQKSPVFADNVDATADPNATPDAPHPVSVLRYPQIVNRKPGVG